MFHDRLVGMLHLFLSQLLYLNTILIMDRDLIGSQGRVRQRGKKDDMKHTAISLSAAHSLEVMVDINVNKSPTPSQAHISDSCIFSMAIAILNSVYRPVSFGLHQDSKGSLRRALRQRRCPIL